LQATILALLTAGAIVALYFLKLRHRRMIVASSLLWGRVLDERAAQSLWEKLRRVISIVVAVLIGLLIALALGRPEIHWLTGGGERTLLVLDAVTGQNGLEQARQFLKVAGVTGIVLTKLDGTAKGGIAVAIAKELNLPIRYAGIGEKVDDLVVFDPQQYVNGLFGN